MGSFSVWHWIIVFIVIGIPALVLSGALRAGVGRPGEVANTWKFRTVVFSILAFITPLWLITLPLFAFLAFRSYKAGDTTIHQNENYFDNKENLQRSILSSAESKAAQLTALHELLKSGALTQDEYDAEKRKVLAAQINPQQRNYAPTVYGRSPFQHSRILFSSDTWANRPTPLAA